MRKLFLFTLSSFLVVPGFSQEKFWKFEIEQSAPKNNNPQLIRPKFYRTLSLSFDQYKSYLKTAPKEIEANVKKGLQISLPYPDNSFKKFAIVETKMMEDKLAAQFPEIKTYIGQGIDEPSATVRIDYTYQGFHAYVISPDGALFIDPYQKANNKLYITYFSKDYENPLKQNFKCGALDRPKASARPLSVNSALTGMCIGAQLKTYRVAISCTGEYAEAVCPAGDVTVANTISAIVTTMNRVNGVYQTELDIKMILIGSNASVVYTDPDTDPYAGNDDGSTLITESQSTITSVIGSSNFDVGHTFSTGGGGLADQGSACNSSFKAKGITGNPDPIGDSYDIDFVAHELGHQFGAAHTFESESANCGNNNRIKLSAYEPGSGTTIMAYAGICGSDNIQPNSNSYFHTRSFDEIIEYTTTGTGSTCPVVSNTGNHAPDIVMPVSGTKIPKGTPFTLTASATDVDGDALTYSWEEWDISNDDNGTAWNSGATSTNTPLFKVRNPRISGSRTFPDPAIILAGYPSNPSAVQNGLKGETLPQIARDIKFRFIARDNQAGGGGIATGGDGCSSTAVFKVVVTDDGPFKLTAPNTDINWLGGTTETVTWDVANTNSAAGINAQNVDILMSTDGGITYTRTILVNTANDGNENITVPNIPTTTTVRFMVRASNSIFFDISDEDLTITFNPAFLQFSATPGGNTILLTWEAITESSTKGFQILRSVGDSNNFTNLALVDPIGNAGSFNNYSWIDTTVQDGVDYYYLLVQIDQSNDSLYAGIKKAKIEKNSSLVLKLLPQPFHKNAQLFLDGIEKTNFTIIVVDIAGRILERKEIQNIEDSRIIPLNLNNKPSGVYLIKVYQDRIKQTLRAVKL